MNYGYFILDLIITMLAYMAVPFCMFFKRKQNYTLKYKKKVLIINSIVTSIIFIILREIISPDTNSVVSFAPALLYYYINNIIWTSKNLEETEKKEKVRKINNWQKFKNHNINKTLIITFSAVIILSIIIGGFITLNTYLNEKNENEETKLRLEKEKQENLVICIEQATNSRTNLWNSNCDMQSNGDCTIPTNSGIIEWIEQRYKQDLEICYQLYGN